MPTSREASIVGAYEHPERLIPDRSVATIHAEVARGALTDAGLTLADVDGYFTSGDAPGGAMVMADYLGLSLRNLAGNDVGGSSYLPLVGAAARAIRDGRCQVALVAMSGRARSGKRRAAAQATPFFAFEAPFGHGIVPSYALAARRHMYEHGTTSAELAEVKVAASLHAQYNPHALLPKPVSIDEVLESPVIADPLRRLDSCVMTDGGGAVVLVSEEIRRHLTPRRSVRVRGQAATVKHVSSGPPDLTCTGGMVTGPQAMAEAGVRPADIDYASIYDSFTITVLMTLEDLGFCEKGAGGAFVRDGALVAPYGRLPVNTDGGSLCNNHPANRGGMIRLIEAVRQLRGEAHPAVQVPDCELAVVHGTGGTLATRTTSATLVLEGLA